MKKSSLFVSSVQKELDVEQRAVRDFVHGDALLGRFFDVFLFEDLPATDRRADDLYMDEVDRCAVYVGILGQEYGSEDAEGLSPTEKEFDRATKRGKYRLVFVKGTEDTGRHAKMRTLIRKAERQLVRRRFAAVPDLTAQLYASLVQYLEQHRFLRSLPFDASPCSGASLRDVSQEKLTWFLREAQKERQYALKINTPPPKALAHLNLLAGNQPTHGAMILFGANPQRFMPMAEVKCLHFHGAEVRKPIPSYQIYRGTAFDQVDQAVDFVLSKINRVVAPRDDSPASRHEYEIPYRVIREAIVNAVAHRDYASNAAVQVMVFVDRIEVCNPGELPVGLTLEQLRSEHPSIPRNPLICDPLFLAHYIEKAGTGTLDMIGLCRDAGLPEPDFEQRGTQFVVTLWRDWLTEAVLAELSLNERQRVVLAYLKTNRRITNAEYQRVTGAIKKTASRDLEDFVRKGVLERVGVTGRGTYYVLSRKRDIKGTNGT